MKVGYPQIQQVTDENYKLIKEIVVCLDKYGKYKFKPPFMFDGASIPRIFWTLIGSPLTGTHSRAAFVHDFLYASELFDRKTCDWIFLLLMKQHGANWIKRNIIWSAVKCGGYFVWKKHNKNEVEFIKTHCIEKV